MRYYLITVNINMRKKRNKKIAQEFQVRLFLAQLKKIARKKRIIFYKDKHKNVQTMSELGISFKDCEEHLLKLTLEDYVEGPTDDSTVFGAKRWVFRKIIEGREMYIRLRIDTDNEEAICESFHFSE